MKQRNHSIDILRFFAALLITNSHMEILYHPHEFLATGGAIGDALFFFSSGFTLFLGRNARFDNWYKRRINRIYPTVFAWALVGSVFFDIHRDMKSILLYGGGWFVTCIMIYYVFLWFIRTYLSKNIKVAVLISLVVVLIWYYFEDKSTVFMYGYNYFKWSFFFLFMLLGAIIGKAYEKVKPYKFTDLLLLFLSIILFYAIQIIGERYELIAKLQILSLIPLLGVTFYFYKFCTSQFILGLYNIRPIHKVVYFISTLCLEIYLVQYSLFTDKMNSLFPMNLIIMFLIIVGAAYSVKILSKLFSQTFSVDDYSWKKMLQP